MTATSNRFTLNTQKRRFLGVCAGLADYLEVPTVVIRIITLLACLAWPTLILVYFVTYWWLKHEASEDGVHNFIVDSKPGQHFRSVDYRKPIYRNPHNARIAGVCSGIADYLEIKTFYVRVLTLLSLFIFGPFTFFAYCVGWIVLERNPEPPAHLSRKQRRRARRNKDYDYDAKEDYDLSSMEDDTLRSSSRKHQANKDAEANIAMSLKECSKIFNTVEVRLRDVEAFITSKKFRLHCEINRI